MISSVAARRPTEVTCSTNWVKESTVHGPTSLPADIVSLHAADDVEPPFAVG
jgi:hypothetical protein